MSHELVKIEIRSLDELDRIAEKAAKSGIFGVKRPEQAFALMMLSADMGVSPMRALQEYHVLADGRVTITASAALGRFKKAGGRIRYLERTEERCTVEAEHAGSKVTVTWTLEDAQRAGLLGSHSWKRYPRQMLSARATMEAIRAVAPEVLSGMYAPEELEGPPLREPAQVVEAGPAPRQPRPKRGVAAVRAAAPEAVAQAPADMVIEASAERIDPETGEVTGAASEPPAPEPPAGEAGGERTPAEEPAVEAGTRKKALAVLGADGHEVARVGNGRGWLAVYRELLARTRDTERPAVMRHNLEMLRRLAARAPADVKADFANELEVALAMAGEPA